MTDDYEVGIKLWCHMGTLPDNPLEEGTLVHKFSLGGPTLYVIEFPTHIDPIYAVRDWMTVSDNGKAINMWKKVFERNKSG
jgi:hypothetical protein